MSRDHVPSSDVLRLPDDLAQRLLARAGELDAQGTGSSIAQLRQAALEAGISPIAFDAALRELWPEVARATSQAAAAPEPAVRVHVAVRPSRRGLLAIALSLLAVVGAVGALRHVRDEAAPGSRVVRPVAESPRSREGAAAQDAYFEFQVEQPVVALNDAAPSYPAELQRRGLSGQVIVQFVVDEEGRVVEDSFRRIESSHALFTESVRAALPRMRFRPAEIGGRRVRQLVQQPFVFDIGT